MMSEKVDSISKKTKVINWTEQTPNDCLDDLAAFCDGIRDAMDFRYACSVSVATHKFSVSQ